MSDRTDTPRTDYETDRLDHFFNGKRVVYASTARQLETELAAALGEIARLKQQNQNLLIQLDAAQKIIKRNERRNTNNH